MTDIIDRLKEPEAHYPGNFDTPKRANAMLSCLCQEAMEEIESLRQQVAEKDAEIERLNKPCQIPVPSDVAVLIERTDWTPEQALQFYADQRNFDIVEGLARIIDNGAVASNALKHLTLDRLELKGDAELTELRQQLAASQAREQQLREAIRDVCCDPDGNVCIGLMGGCYADKEVLEEALAIPQDTSALSAMIAKAGEVMRERCLSEFWHEMSQSEVEVFIRAIHGVTLEDLK